MFADPTKPFLTNKDISYFLETANIQLKRIKQWFT